MGAKETRLCLMSAIRLLESVHMKREQVLENPFTFDEVIASCERRARFLRSRICRKRKRKEYVVRRRIFNRDGRLLNGLSITSESSCVLVFNGLPVLKPNGEKWTKRDIEVARRQCKV